MEYAIVALEDGKIYVQADRKVLSGTDRGTWKTQIDTFFDRVILQNGSLTVESVEGDELTITKDETIWKGKDEHVLETGIRRPLRDNEYLIKLSALSHIDELAEASVVQRNADGSRKIEPDKKNHPFAKDGFEYRTVYFKDLDGKYYRIVLSVGQNDGISTVYNVGKIKEAVAPEGSVISAIGSKAQGVTATDNRVTEKPPVVNTQSMQNGKNYSKGAYLPPERMTGDALIDPSGERGTSGRGTGNPSPTTRLSMRRRWTRRTGNARPYSARLQISSINSSLLTPHSPVTRTSLSSYSSSEASAAPHTAPAYILYIGGNAYGGKNLS
ncbi:MAG: hypothetical protein IJC33_06380 [Clostridia bacterium]|nr:hypothetical protein [Clostridia bacterium]